VEKGPTKKLIIIIDKTTLFEPYVSLDDSARLHPVFSLLDFAIIFLLLQNKLVKFEFNP
jgi:hypothetical protein